MTARLSVRQPPASSAKGERERLGRQRAGPRSTLYLSRRYRRRAPVALSRRAKNIPQRSARSVERYGHPTRSLTISNTQDRRPLIFLATSMFRAASPAPFCNAPLRAGSSAASRKPPVTCGRAALPAQSVRRRCRFPGADHRFTNSSISPAIVPFFTGSIWSASCRAHIAHFVTSSDTSGISPARASVAST